MGHNFNYYRREVAPEQRRCPLDVYHCGIGCTPLYWVQREQGHITFLQNPEHAA